MRKDLLRQYAEAGVRNRLKEIQRELDELHKEFPEIVANANGTIPTVAPVEMRRGRMGTQVVSTPDPAWTKVAAYLAAHPGATTDELAPIAGLQPTSYFRARLKTIARDENRGRGGLGSGQRGTYKIWYLKDGQPPLNGNGARPHPQLRKDGKRRVRAVNLDPQMITDLLTAKPGLTYAEIARDLDRHPTGGLMKMVRKLARPKRAGKFQVWTLKA